MTRMSVYSVFFAWVAATVMLFITSHWSWLFTFYFLGMLWAYMMMTRINVRQQMKRIFDEHWTFHGFIINILRMNVINRYTMLDLLLNMIEDGDAEIVAGSVSRATVIKWISKVKD